MRISSELVRALARDCGFELAGVTPAEAIPEADSYQAWVARGYAGEMAYLTDRRALVRNDPRNLLASARSIICVGKLYNSPLPNAAQLGDSERAWISRYAWGEDYHEVLRRGLSQLAEKLREQAGVAFESKVCVDTAPLLERAYARRAGLGWIGKNTCLINQPAGSWFFLGELLVSLAIEPDRPPPDRCGTCTRCIEVCPTQAIVPVDDAAYAIDSRLCISYFTIELRGPVAAESRAGVGSHVFGCDICQDVCPWNRRAPVTAEQAFQAAHFAPPLEKLAAISEDEFRAMFAASPIRRARYTGFLRNVAIAMGNARSERFRAPLEKMAQSADAAIADHAVWALAQLESS
jgi:epoxyqueuosine reductase